MMDINNTFIAKTLVFFFPILIFPLIARHYMIHKKQFSRKILYIFPFVFPSTAAYMSQFAHYNFYDDFFRHDYDTIFLMPYIFASCVYFATLLASFFNKKIKSSIATLSYFEIFCVQAAFSTLGAIFSIIALTTSIVINGR